MMVSSDPQVAPFGGSRSAVGVKLESERVLRVYSIRGNAARDIVPTYEVTPIR